MRMILTVLLLMSLMACTSMRQFGEGVCATQTEISDGITELGGFAGPPGMVLARALNIVLSTTCNVIAGVASMPADVTGDVTGMFASEEPVAEDPGR